MEIMKTAVGWFENQEVVRFTLKNSSGIEVSFLNYGGRTQSIMAPDGDGKLENIVLGYDYWEEYVTDKAYLGAICGPVAGRIRNGIFKLEGKDVYLTRNDGNHHLHGGQGSLSDVIWDHSEIREDSRMGINLICRFENGTNGYPGPLEINVAYELDESGRLIIEYTASSPVKTIFNPTSHMYFNLNGSGKGNILNHYLQVPADYFLPLDAEALPLGVVNHVQDTAFDLRTKRNLRLQFQKEEEQLCLANRGYNHPFVLDPVRKKVILEEETSRRRLTVETDMPSVVVYSASYFDGSFKIGGCSAVKYMGLCLETQGYPDAVNHPTFPSIFLEPGEVYRSRTTYAFGIID